MYPQSELDNYKLQVELLQEKLQRSEENRQHLEQDLTQILQKRSEHDKLARAKTRQKYQKFLDEQTKRNERNKLLVQMLERIDQQTTALSARSERLKMMKLQYEMYFTKLVQSQTMRCIQGIAPTVAPTAASTLPFVVPESHVAPTFLTSTPIKSNDLSDSGIGNINMPLRTHFADQRIAAGGGFLGNTTPRLRLVAVPDWSLSEYDKMNEAYLSGMAAATAAAAAATPTRTTTTMNLPATQCAVDDFDKGFAPLTTIAATTKTTAMPMQKYDEEQQMLSTVSAITTPLPSYSTAPATLSFDKLPKTPTLTMAAPPNFDVADDVFVAAATAAVAARKPQPAATMSFAEQLPNRNVEGNFENEYVQPSTTKSLTNVAAADAAVNSNGNNAASANVATMRRQPKIDEAGWQQQQASLNEPHVGAAQGVPSRPTEWEAGRQRHLAAMASENNRSSSKLNSYEEDRSQNATVNQCAAPGFAGISEGAGEVEATEVKALLPAAGAGNQSTLSQKHAPPSAQPQQSTVSIENIENAIYGELVNPTMPAEHTADIRQATQGLLEDLVTQPLAAEASAAYAEQQQQHLPMTHASPDDYANYNTIPGVEVDEVSYNPTTDTSDATSYEPTYATIEGTTEAEVYRQQQQQIPSADAVYSDGSTPAADYAQYGGEEAAAAATQQEYADYANYDASQYDPATAYPGYTYDEATGQYTPDEATQQQYAAAEDEQQAQYAASAEGAAYAAAAGYEQQPYDDGTSGQEANYDYSNYAATQEASATNVPYVAPAVETAPQEIAGAVPTEVAAAAPASPSPLLPVAEAAATTPKVPTSILSSAAAAANDAALKKKKRVNFVDSSETDESSSAKAAVVGGGDGGSAVGAGAAAVSGFASSESDFDFSTSASEVVAAAAPPN